MIFVEMSGGLGNQIFQYAAGRLFQENKKCDVTYFYTSMTASNHDYREIAIDKFGISSNWIRHSDESKIFEKHRLQGAVYKAMNYITCKLYSNITAAGQKEERFFRFKWNVLNRFGIYFQQFDYCFPIKKSWFKDVFVLGMWQVPTYFQSIMPHILEEIRLDASHLEADTKKMIAQLENTNSVCVHVRRGDYIRVPGYAVCTLSYYKRAIQEICKRVQDPTFYFFSDDIAWVRENLSADGFECVYVDGDNKDYIDFEIMRHGKHFIISNSTFSFWASTLGGACDKQICAPDRWFMGDDRGKVLYQKEWILVDTVEE